MASVAPTLAQPFAGHQAAMLGHGVPHGAHPISQGHSSNQGVPGGVQQAGMSIGPQMQPGVTGPGGSQVSQAGPMMTAMMPGGGPPVVSMGGVVNANTMSHLQPGHQGQLLSQQNMEMSEQSLLLLLP